MFYDEAKEIQKSMQSFDFINQSIYLTSFGPTIFVLTSYQSSRMVQ